MISYIKTTLATENILLSKLYAYGIKGSSIKWFESFFCNRTQYVKINDVESSIETIIFGLPQGSTLEPLLLLLFINDLPSSCKLSFRITTEVIWYYQLN